MSPVKPPLPFSFPLESAETIRRRSSILVDLLASDEDFCEIPVRRMKAQTLERMLALYDQRFLNGFLQESYGALKVTLSSRLLSSAGKFIYSRSPALRMESAEIRMSSDFLFRLNEGPFNVNGLAVATAQEAFLVVFEHELCHALETALYGSTGHSKRFLALANGLFGHTGTTHSLPTRRQEARANGWTVGQTVRFRCEGETLTGRISYLGVNATVMAPCPTGEYRDRRGRRYAKFRVPISQLMP